MNRQPEHIAVDIDDVLFPFARSFIKEHNSIYGSSLTVDDFFTYEFEQVMGLSIEEVFSRLNKFHEKGYDFYQPLTGAEKAIRSLSKKVEISIITSRNPRYEVSTRIWLNNHFSDLYKEIVLVGHPHEVSHKVTKAEVCQQIGAELLIDDSVSHLQACVDSGIKGILFGDYPWNRGLELPVGVVACSNWQEVLDYFETD